MRIYSRRNILRLTVASLTLPTLAAASDFEEIDPADTVPRRFSVERFLSLDENDIYDVNLAIRRGRGITIEGYSRSESRKIITLAAKDLAAARARLAK